MKDAGHMVPMVSSRLVCCVRDICCLAHALLDVQDQPSYALQMLNDWLGVGTEAPLMHPGQAHSTYAAEA